MTHLTGSGYGVERPQGLAILRAECSNTASGGELAAGKAADNHPVVVERRARDGEPVLPALRLYGPQLLAGVLIQRDNRAVKPSQENFPLADRDAAAGPTAAHRRNGFFQVRLINPKLLAGSGVDCKHIVRAGWDIDHAILDDGLRLAGEWRPNA